MYKVIDEGEKVFNKIVERTKHIFSVNDSPHNPCGRTEEYYYNELEEYTRYLELKLNFYEWHQKSNKQKHELKEYSDSSGGVTFDKELDMTIIICADCRFGCGSAPCGCKDDYILYLTLKKKMGFVDNNFSFDLAVSWVPEKATSLRKILKIFDKNKYYKKFNKSQEK